MIRPKETDHQESAGERGAGYAQPHRPNPWDGFQIRPTGATTGALINHSAEAVEAGVLVARIVVRFACLP
jgi:hypothetical protein